MVVGLGDSGEYLTRMRWFSMRWALVTPHAQRERGKVIDRGVHIYIYIYMSVVEKNI